MILGLCGPAGAGKTTVAEMLCREGRGVAVPLAAPLYRAVQAMFGLEEADLVDRGKKEATIDWIGLSPRRLLQTLGTEWGRQIIGDHIWTTVCLRRAAQLLEAGERLVVIPDVRFNDEAVAIRKAGGIVVAVERPVGCVLGEAMKHPSEYGVSAVLIDRFIVNRGSLDDFAAAVNATLKEYL